MSAAPKGDSASLAARIAQVERRLELRRERTLRNVAGARADVEHAGRWLPLAGVAGALAVGLIVGRRSGPSRDAAPAPPGGVVAAARTGILASILGLSGTALRIALSPSARALWAAYGARRRADAPR